MNYARHCIGLQILILQTLTYILQLHSLAWARENFADITFVDITAG